VNTLLILFALLQFPVKEAAICQKTTRYLPRVCRVEGADREFFQTRVSHGGYDYSCSWECYSSSNTTQWELDSITIHRKPHLGKTPSPPPLNDYCGHPKCTYKEPSL